MNESEFLNALLREMATGADLADVQALITGRIKGLQIVYQLVKEEQEQRERDMIERLEWERKLRF